MDVTPRWVSVNSSTCYTSLQFGRSFTVTKMNTSFVIVFALYISRVAAFGLSGAYERMLYWYAYLMDPGEGNERLVAKGCNSCTFAEFIEHIDGHRDIPKGQIEARLQGFNPTDVDHGAAVLDDNRIVGPYGVPQG